MKKSTKNGGIAKLGILIVLVFAIMLTLSSCDKCWTLIYEPPLEERPLDTYIDVQNIYQNGKDNIKGLENPWGIAVSPDNANVYVAGSNNVVAFTADSAGNLTFLERTSTPIVQGASTPNDDSLVGAGVGARSIVVSEDGMQVYVSIYEDNTIKVFNRDTSTGKLKLIQTLVHGSIDSAGNSIEGLEGAIDILASSDNNHVYVLGYKSDAIVTFARNKNTNKLEYKGQLQNSSKESGLEGPREMIFGANETRLYVVGHESDSLVRLTRDANTGVLTINKVYTDTDDFKNAISMDGEAVMDEPIDIVMYSYLNILYIDISTGTYTWGFIVDDDDPDKIRFVDVTNNKKLYYYIDNLKTWKSDNGTFRIPTESIQGAKGGLLFINYEENIFFWTNNNEPLSGPREIQQIGNSYIITSSKNDSVVQYGLYDRDIERGACD